MCIRWCSHEPIACHEPVVRAAEDARHPPSGRENGAGARRQPRQLPLAEPRRQTPQPEPAQAGQIRPRLERPCHQRRRQHHRPLNLRRLRQRSDECRHPARQLVRAAQTGAGKPNPAPADQGRFHCAEMPGHARAAVRLPRRPRDCPRRDSGSHQPPHRRLEYLDIAQSRRRFARLRRPRRRLHGVRPQRRVCGSGFALCRRRAQRQCENPMPRRKKRPLLDQRPAPVGCRRYGIHSGIAHQCLIGGDRLCPSSACGGNGHPRRGQCGQHRLVAVARQTGADCAGPHRRREPENRQTPRHGCRLPALRRADRRRRGRAHGGHD